MALLVFYVTVGFGQSKTEKNTQYYAIKRAKEDSTFLALKAVAQKSMAKFIDSLQKNGVNIQDYRFSVKSDFADKNHHEHLWSQILAFENGYFVGIFIDASVTLKNIKFGDSVRIKKEDIEDWEIENLKTQTHSGYFSENYPDNQK